MSKSTFTPTVTVTKSTKPVSGSVGADGTIITAAGAPLTAPVITFPDGTETTIGNLVKSVNTLPVWQQVVVAALIKEQIKPMENVLDALNDKLAATKISDISDSLTSSGFSVGSDGPAIAIDMGNGNSVNISLKADVDTGFTVDKDLKDIFTKAAKGNPAEKAAALKQIDGMPDWMVNKDARLASASILEEHFDKDDIPSLYKGFFSKSPVEGTKISSKSKGGKL